jgi:transcriptional regulator with XRE-family HTH domain
MIKEQVEQEGADRAVSYRDDRLRAEMALQRLTDADLAAKSGVSEWTIGRLRRGDAADARYSTFVKIAAALGKDAAWLTAPRESEPSSSG